MRLVVDASTLVAEVLRARGRRLISHPELDLVVAADAWDETLHELRKRVTLLVSRGYMENPAAIELLELVLITVSARVVVAPSASYADLTDAAYARIPRDPRDVATVALALATDRAIWTSDADFFGCGVAVWTTETILIHIGMSSTA